MELIDARKVSHRLVILDRWQAITTNLEGLKEGKIKITAGVEAPDRRIFATSTRWNYLAEEKRQYPQAWNPFTSENLWKIRVWNYLTSESLQERRTGITHSTDQKWQYPKFWNHFVSEVAITAFWNHWLVKSDNSYIFGNIWSVRNGQQVSRTVSDHLAGEKWQSNLELHDEWKSDNIFGTNL